MSVIYEWDIETVDLCLDNDPDILEHYFAEKLREFNPDDFAPNRRLVLVRDELDCAGSTVDRGWAYVSSGKLPEYFSDAYDVTLRYLRVPKRSHKELHTALKISLELHDKVLRVTVQQM